MENIAGSVNRIIFNNPENGYTVLELSSPTGNIVAMGNCVSLSAGEHIELYGDWVEHPKYGRQFRFDNITVAEPTSREQIKSLLTSELITGIGDKRADELLGHFGDELLFVIENDYLRLTELPGIGKIVAKRIHESYMEHFDERRVVMQLGKYDLSPNMALKLYRQYGGTAARIVEKNPYKLIDDVYGVGFARADAIAQKIGISADSKLRVSAGIDYVLGTNVARGNTFCRYDELVSQTARLLGVEESEVEDNLCMMDNAGKIVLDREDEEIRVYFFSYHLYETYVAEALAALAKAQCGEAEEHIISERVDDYERYNGITLEDLQRDAVRLAVTNRISVITGGPGTGKTTIIKAIIYILDLLGRSYALAAPTGRASKRMSEACGGREAKTIHRLLEYGFTPDGSIDDEPVFNRNEENKLEYDTVIIDEASMVDMQLMYYLMCAVDTERTSLIFVGDSDQLPSVGAGSVLADMRDSGLIECVKLTQIYRQTEQSLIVKNAHQINSGHMPKLDGANTDFLFFGCVTQQKIAAYIMRFISENRYDCLDMMKRDELKILSPFKKGEAGVINLNIKLQALINPPSDSKAELSIPNYTLREGDRVMQIKNDYNLKWTNKTTLEVGEGIFNGDMGVVTDISKESRIAHVLFENERKVVLEAAKLDELTLSYAITIHKSQGSEFPAVMIPVFYGNPEFLTRNIIYTAITRAKSRVILIGEQNALRMMIENRRGAPRESGLCARIKKHTADAVQ